MSSSIFVLERILTFWRILFHKKKKTLLNTPWAFSLSVAVLMDLAQISYCSWKYSDIWSPSTLLFLNLYIRMDIYVAIISLTFYIHKCVIPFT